MFAPKHYIKILNGREVRNIVRIVNAYIRP